MGRYFDFNKKDPKPISEKKARIRKHNAMIIEKRGKGELKPLGSMTYSQVMKEYKGYKKQIRQITESGSVLPNVYARWSPPFDNYCELDY